MLMRVPMRNGLEQLLARDRGGATLHHFHATSEIGQPRGLRGFSSGGQRRGKGGDHDIAGARHVRDLVAPVNREEGGWPLTLQQRHAQAPSRDEKVTRVKTIEEL